MVTLWPCQALLEGHRPLVVEQLGCKIRVKDAAGNPKCERQADELDVTRMFGRKRRVDPTQTSTLRNGIGVSKPGDKRYSHPDYAPGFFKGGGVYPGSGWGYVGPIVAAIAPLASHHSVCLCVCVCAFAATRSRCSRTTRHSLRQRQRSRRSVRTLRLRGA